MSAYLSLIGRRRGWALLRGWALINFFCLEDGCLFELVAKSRLGAYSNKYGIEGSIDYNGVAFSLELLERDHTFLEFGGSENSGR